MRESTVKVFFELVKRGLFSHTKTTDSTENLVPCFKLQISSDIDWGEVYRLAEEQSVIGLVSAGLDWFKVNDSRFMVLQTVALQFIGQTLQIEQRNKAMNNFIADLIMKLRKADIYAILVKGQGLAQCYEKPLWRTCGDVDLFLSDENYEKAKEFLIPRASSVETEGVYGRHLGMSIDGWVVELHGRLRCGFSGRVDRVLDEIQNETFYGGSVSSWNNNGVQVFKLSKENEVLYVFAHFLGHFYKGGIGLRQICDWCRLLYTYRGKLDYGLLESRIRKAGLMSEWKAFGAMAIEYLGLPIEAMPLLSQDNCHNANLKKKADRIIEFIMMSGNMGHNRNSSYLRFPFLVRKFFSMARRTGDLINHARIFPLDSLRFFPRIMFNGLRSAMRGE